MTSCPVFSVAGAADLIRKGDRRGYAILPTSREMAQELKQFYGDPANDDIDFRSYPLTRFGDVIVLFRTGAISEVDIRAVAGVIHLN